MHGSITNLHREVTKENNAQATVSWQQLERSAIKDNTPSEELYSKDFVHIQTF